MPTSHHKNWRPCQSQLSMYVRHCSSWDVQRRTQLHDRLSCWTAWIMLSLLTGIWRLCVVNQSPRRDVQMLSKRQASAFKIRWQFSLLEPSRWSELIYSGEYREICNQWCTFHAVLLSLVSVMYVWMHHASGWTRSDRSVVRLIYYVERLRLMCGSSVCTSLRFTWSSLSAPAMTQWNPLLKIL